MFQLASFNQQCLVDKRISPNSSQRIQYILHLPLMVTSAGLCYAHSPTCWQRFEHHIHSISGLLNWQSWGRHTSRVQLCRRAARITATCTSQQANRGQVLVYIAVSLLLCQPCCNTISSEEKTKIRRMSEMFLKNMLQITDLQCLLLRLSQSQYKYLTFICMQGGLCTFAVWLWVQNSLGNKWTCNSGAMSGDHKQQLCLPNAYHVHM